MNKYKNINYELKKRYLDFLRDKRTDLKVKAIGSYWTKYKWTKKDQQDFERIERKINSLINFY